MPPIQSSPGTYLILLALPCRLDLRYGRGGRVRLAAGLYGYVGSALGPGGLAARLRRHLAGSPRHHWHIDSLLPHASPVGALVSAGTERLECLWAAWVRANALSTASGFGASDCRCEGHLFHLGEREAQAGFLRRAHRALGASPVARTDLNALIE